MSKPKTYGSKSAKRKQIQDESHDVPLPTTSSSWIRKRQRVEVEIIRSPAAQRILVSDDRSTNCHSKNATPETTAIASLTPPKKNDSSSPSTEEDSAQAPPTPSRRQPLRTYGSPHKVNLLESPVKPESLNATPDACSQPVTPRKPARNLSGIFNDTLSPSHQHWTSPSSTKVVGRMLSRSQTEPSLTNKSNMSGSSLVADASKTPNGPSRGRKPLTSSKSFPATNQTNPSPEPEPIEFTRGVSNKRSLRTYAGASRSFLVSLPASQVTGDSATLSALHEDEFVQRESYKSLRTRWGVDDSEDDSVALPQPPTPRKNRNSSPTKGKGKGKASAPILAPPLPSSMMNDLKSITELRSKGESRRFLDEIGYLFEGMDPTGAVGLRRVSAIEIINKFCDADFARKAKAADFYGRTWDIFREAGAGDGDKVLDTVLLAFAALVACDSDAISDLVQRSKPAPTDSPEVMVTLINLLAQISQSQDTLAIVSSDYPPAELRKMGISKSELMQLTNIRDTILNRTNILPPGTPLSGALLISIVFSTLPSSYLLSSQFPSFLIFLRVALQPFPNRLDAYASGLPLFPQSSNKLDTPPLAHADNCLRMLDTFLLGQWSSPDADNDGHSELDSAREEWLADCLISLGIVCGVIIADPSSYPQYWIEQAIRCLESVYRVLMSLTHENDAWCQAFLKRKHALSHVVRTIASAEGRWKNRARYHRKDSKAATKADVEEDRASEVGEEVDGDSPESMQALDCLCLALALLTNIVQEVDEVKDLIRETSINRSCPLKRTCIRECTCPNSISALNLLASVYVAHFKTETDDSHMGGFLCGHLAILFGLLMDRNKNNEAVLDALPGTNRLAKLDQLIEQTREFVAFYRILLSKLQPSRTGGRHREMHITRGVQAEEARDKEMIRHDHPKGVDGVDGVVSEVVTFLERLRAGIQ